MDELTFYNKQLEIIERMYPQKKEKDGECSGDLIEAKGYPFGDYYVIEINREDGSKKLYFDKSKYTKFYYMTNQWINEEVLNQTGLETKIWGLTEKKDTLRRRLVQKAARMTFTDEEKKLILSNIENFYKDVKKSLKY